MQPSELLLADAIFLLGWFVLAWVITLIELGFWAKPPGKGLPDIQPWSISGLFGIFLAPFLHRSWGHLRSNTLPFFILGGFILLRHPLDLIVITITIAVVSGFLTWLLGRTYTVQGNRIINIGYAGLSQVIFGYAGFLLALFYFDRTVASAILLALTILFFGRGLRWMLPSERLRRARIAWDGHLIGFIVGAFVAAYLPNLRPVSIALLQALDVPTQFTGITIAGTVIDERFYRQTLPPLVAQYAPIFWERFRRALQFIAAAWIIAFVDFQLVGGILYRNLGIRPWTLRGLVGIPLHPVLHSSWNHLAGNTRNFLIFATLLVLVRPDDFVVITIAIILITGTLIWLTAVTPTRGYVGASALNLGYIGFLLSLYYFENSILAASLLFGTVLLLLVIEVVWRRAKLVNLLLLRRPSLITTILPRGLDNSWGHFLGFLSGVIVAAYLPGLRSYADYLIRTFNLR